MRSLVVLVTFMAALWSDVVSGQSMETNRRFICGQISEGEVAEYGVQGSAKHETISLVGLVAYQSTGSYKGYDEAIEVIWDKMTQTFILTHSHSLENITMQSAMYIPGCEQATASEECQVLNAILSNNAQLTLRFLYKRIDNPSEWTVCHKHSRGWAFNMDDLFPAEGQLCWSVPDYKMGEHSIWPDQWKVATGDDHGVGTYWQTMRTFMYVINGKGTNNAKLYTRSLSDMHKKVGWNVTEIADTKGKVFTSLFYWILDGSVMAQIIDRGYPKELAPVYQYVPESRSFAKKHDSPRQLFMCPPIEQKSQVLIWILAIVTPVLLGIIVVVVGYYCIIWLFGKNVFKKRAPKPVKMQ